MNVNETDFELLEQHLDGALEAAALTQLQARLETDSALVDALGELKAQRAVRQAVWNAIDPDTVSADRLTWRIRGAMLNADRAAAAPVQSRSVWNPWRIASVCSAAAACVLLGFAVGRIGHGPSTPGLENARLQNVGLRGDAGTTPVAVETKPNLPAPYTGPKISIPFTDPDTGEVVAWQTFNSPDDAKKFTKELHDARTQTPAPAATGNIRTVDHEQQVGF
jgi:hypothetical protein